MSNNLGTVIYTEKKEQQTFEKKFHPPGINLNGTKK